MRRFHPMTFGGLRRRLSILLLMTLALSTLTPQVAQASTPVPESPLVLGTSVSLTPAFGDLHIYKVTVPADQRFTLSVAGSGTPVTVYVGVLDDTTNAILGTGQLSNADPALQFFDVDPAPAARTLRVQLQQMTGSGTLQITPNTITDAAPAPLGWNSATTAIVGLPGQQAPLTFTGVPGARLGVTITGSTFPTGTLRAFLLVNGYRSQELTSDGPTTPGLPMEAATYSVVIDGAGASTGAATVRVEQVQDVTGNLTLGDPVTGPTTTVDVSTVWTQASFPYSTVPGARRKFEVVSSTLHHADGSPGAMTVTSQRTFFGYRTSTYVASVTNTPSYAVQDALMSTVSTETLVMVPDGLSTGTVTFRLTALVDNPTVAAALRQPTVAQITTPYTSRSYSFAAVTGQPFELTMSGATFTSANSPTMAPLVLVEIFDPQGQQVLALDPASTPGTPWVAAQSGTYTVVVDPQADAVGSLTITLADAVETVVPVTVGTPVSTTFARTIDRVVLDSPGRPGAMVPGITLESFTSVQPPWPIYYAGLTLQFRQGGVDVGSPLGFNLNQQLPSSIAGPSGLDPTLPWHAVITTTVPGSATLTMHDPVVRSLPATVGRPQSIAFGSVSDVTTLTIRPKVGQRVVVQATYPGDAPFMQLQTAAGDVVVPPMYPDYFEFGPVTSTTPLALVVTPRSGSLGGSTVTVRLVDDPVLTARGATTVRWATGQNPHLTFSGDKGKRVVVSVSAPSWTPTDLVTVSLLDAGGNLLQQLPTQLQSGVPTLLDFGFVFSADGRYTVVLDPVGQSSGSLTATLTQVTDLHLPARLRQAVPVSIEQPGQQALITVSLPKGATTGLHWTASNPGFDATLTLLDPTTGRPYGYPAFVPTGPTVSGDFGAPALPAGTYVVMVDPAGGAVGTSRLTFTGP